MAERGVTAPLKPSRQPKPAVPRLRHRPISKQEFEACRNLVAGDDPEVAYLKAGHVPAGSEKKRFHDVRRFFRRPVIIAQIAALRAEQLETLDAMASANWIVRRLVALHEYAFEKVPDETGEGWRVRDPVEARRILEILHALRASAEGAMASVQTDIVPLAQRLAYYTREELAAAANGATNGSGNGAAH